MRLQTSDSCGYGQRTRRYGTPDAGRNWAEDEQALSALLGQLEARRLVDRAEEFYSLTAEGSAVVKKLTGPEFGKWMTACEHSAAYLKFCQQVYGTSRCQFNMMTERQLSKLVEVLRLGENDRVLELGCGIGTITEHIAAMHWR